MRTKVPNLHITLALSQMSDKERIDLAKHIAQLAPASSLYSNPHIQAAVAQVSTLGTKLGTDDSGVGDLESQLALSKEVRAATRSNYDKAMGVLTSLAQNEAKTPDEAASLGFINARVGRGSPAPLTPPDGVVVKLGRKHGQFRAAAKTAATHGRFGAQISTDPVTPASWQDVAGSGKVRLITGHASGSLVWVRFRALRGTTASDWCAPVPVTVP